MSRPRPRRAARPSAAVRVARVAVPLALVGLGASGVVAFALPGTDAQTAVPAPVTTTSEPALVRDQPLSRDLTRTPSPRPTASASPKKSATSSAGSSDGAKGSLEPTKLTVTPSADDLAAHPKVSRSLWATDDLSVRADPSKASDVVDVVEDGTKLAATATVRDGFRLVSYRGKGRWVTAAYVSTTKPKPKPAPAAQKKSSSSSPGSSSSGSGSSSSGGGTSRAACSQGSAMERGLTSDAILVHRTLCARYPQITSYGGLRGGETFHATGQAVDCMISDSTVGWQVARWVRAHARQLGVSEVIYSQHIWTVQRSGEGWRAMADRGSRTANHYDHVHVSVYGSRAS